MNIRFTLALLGAGFPLVVGANNDSPDLSEVIVTASRTAETLDTTLAAVTVITRADIDRLQPHSIADLMVGLPGVSMAITGDLGKVTSLFLRGTNSDHVLVLIDGIKIGSATFGSAALEQLPVEQINRIEIVRGPRSSLYGSEALGGVIQIFTRHGDPDAAGEPSMSISGGSHATYQGEAGYSGSYGNSWYNASVSGLSTHGIQLCVDNAPMTAGCYTTVPRQGFWSESAAVSGGYRWNDHAELSLDWLRANGDTKFDGNIYSGNDSRLVQQALGAKLNLTPFTALNISLAVGQSLDQSALNFSGTPVGHFNTRRNTFSWLNDLNFLPTQKLTLGADYEKDAVESDTAYAVTSRHDLGVFGLYQWTLGRGELQLSEREDDNQQFGHHATSEASWGYRFSEALRFMASYGTAFKAPTFNDLYFPYYGNANLQPETSHSVEFGVSGRSSPWNWAVNAYQTEIDHLIEYNPVTFGADNIDLARIRGIEAQLGTHGPKWRAQIYLSWMDPRDRAAGANFNHVLPFRARQTARLDLDRDFGSVNVGTTLYASGPRFNDPANTERLGGYDTVDVRIAYRFNPYWQVQALLKNAFNRDYVTVLYYNQLGRSVYLTLRYSPSAL
ncbi:MAG TPA: TonB-dependent receptor [Steroidobacteraceae bacterium]